MKVSMHLTINIDYNIQDRKEIPDLKRQLHHAANFLAGQGLLSGELDATVDSWDSIVRRG